MVSGGRRAGIVGIVPGPTTAPGEWWRVVLYLRLSFVSLGTTAACTCGSAMCHTASGGGTGSGENTEGGGGANGASIGGVANMASAASASIGNDSAAVMERSAKEGRTPSHEGTYALFASATDRSLSGVEAQMAVKLRTGTSSEAGIRKGRRQKKHVLVGIPLSLTMSSASREGGNQPSSRLKSAQAGSGLIGVADCRPPGKENDSGAGERQ
jgi:hypothetical protein